MNKSDMLLLEHLEKIRKDLDDYLVKVLKHQNQSEIKGVDDIHIPSGSIVVGLIVQEKNETLPIYIPEHLMRRKTQNLDEVLKAKEESFSEMLLRLIDEKGLKDSEVYKKANIDRRLFSKIRGDEDYVPSKKTALSFCFALQLNLCQTDTLQATAGYKLSSSSRFDLIIKYLILNGEYNIQVANIVLEDYGEDTLSR